MKKCSKCNLLKEYTEYSKHIGHKDGLNSACRVCMKESRDAWKIKNKSKVIESNKSYYKNNKSKICLSSKEYKKFREEYYKEYYKEYRIKNLEKLQEYSKSYSQQNRKCISDYNKQYQKSRKKTDELFKFRVAIRNNISDAFKRSIKKGVISSKKNIEIEKILGCSIGEFRIYLEKLFTEQMNWENHGKFGWHIDHIIPISSAKTQEEVEKLCHYTNLQPLWWRDNLTKSNKII